MEREARIDALRRNERIPEITLRLHQEKSAGRRYDLPQVAHEVGVVFCGNAEGYPPLQYDIEIQLREQPGRKIKIHPLNPIADPLCYPILFPRGEKGWIKGIQYADIENRKRVNVTRLEMTTYRVLSIRDHYPIHIYNFGKLFQQYVVDTYVKIENDRLRYVQENQSQLRAHQYHGLIDYVTNLAEREEVRIGRAIILPSSFVGGPRDMQQNFQDAMAIVAKFGRPDLFITFTCNPRWPEIVNNAKTWEDPHNRVDLMCRVFREKLKEFLNDCTKKQIFGNIQAYVYVIEFQKRGLPHCHLLLTLDEEFKLRDPDAIDSMISAEIPDPKDTLLFDTISRFNVHGPCGSEIPDAVCMDEGKCTKKYPKRFLETTTLAEDSYPIYKRSNNGRVIDLRRGHRIFQVDNRSIVPYCPYLSKKYNCHINIEICSGIKYVKYLFKYVTKGHDCALLRMDVSTGVYDEVSHFIDTRYVSACEGFWRMFKYPLHGTSHTIMRLLFHLPGARIVYFREGNEEGAIENAADKPSMFEAWFKLNESDVHARPYLYPQIPLFYRYDNSKHKWIKRVYKTKVIPRMYTISPKFTELFYLRVLLLNVPGARTYEELRTVNGTLHETYQNAARAMGLLNDDSEWTKCMQEAVLLKMPGQLRKLFAYLLICCTVSEPRILWDTYRPELIHDFIRKGHCEEIAEMKALMIIERIIRSAGGNYNNFELPPIIGREGIDIEDDSDTERRGANYTEDLFRESIEANITSFNIGQRAAYDAIMTAIVTENGNDRMFFLDGPGGTGKTFLYNAILDQMRLERKTSVAVAWTGIAATLLRGGRTVHSKFRLPLNVSAGSTSAITMESDEARELKAAAIIIWDEVTMANVNAFNAVDRLLQDVMKDPRPFGGKVILIGGDFRQCLPVVRGGHKTTIIEACLVNAPTWPRFRHLRLTENMRADQQEVDFAEWLIHLGEGRLTNQYNASRSSETIPIPSECVVDDIVTAIYGNMSDFSNTDIAQIPNKSILTPTNDGCDEINKLILEKMPGKGVTYRSADTVQTDDDQEAANYTTEYLNSITPSGMPPHCLTLKPGVPIMLVRNISIVDGLCNGTRLIVRRLFDSLIEAEISMGQFRGSKYLLPRMDLTSEGARLPFTLKRRQFPVRICFAMTINKAQGQTFDSIGIYLPNPVFAHGQLYVAFSRVKRWSAVKVQIATTRTQGCLTKNSATTYTENVVYKNLLSLIKRR